MIQAFFEHAPTVLLAACALVLALFVGFYLALSRWRATSVGQIVMGLCIALLATLSIGLSRSMFGDWPGIDIVRTAVYLFMFGGLVRLFGTLRRIQRTHVDGTIDPPLVVMFLDALRRRKPHRKDQP